MVGLIVATHGHLGAEMVHTAEQIVGKLQAIETCSIEPGTSLEDLRAQMRAAVQKVETGEGVLVLADLVGGTPCNESITLCTQCNLEVVTGVNLPMLIKAHALRAQGTLSLEELALALTQYGQKNITCPTATLKGHLAAGR